MQFIIFHVLTFFRSFPHPHFDKPIPDPTDMPPGNKNMTQFLHLRKTFHDAIRDPAYEWELLPISQSLLKLRLENTKVKGNRLFSITIDLRDLVS